jgi:hypothetical protein
MLMTNIVVQDGRELRKHLLMHLFKYHENGAEYNITKLFYDNI